MLEPVSYRLEVWYGDTCQAHESLTLEQATDAAGAFSRDLLRPDSGIRKLVVERENPS